MERFWFESSYKKKECTTLPTTIYVLSLRSANCSGWLRIRQMR